MAKNSVDRITRGFLRQKSGDFDIESIIILDLNGYGIKELGHIEECNNLEFLNLSNNNITNLIPLACLVHLTYLNLSGNNIACLEGLQILENLETLNLAGNLIGSLDTLYSISGLSKLKHLMFQDPNNERTNPICRKQNYKSKILSMFPKLQSLDREILHGTGSDVNQLFQQIEWRLNAMSSQKHKSFLTDAKPVEPVKIPAKFWAIPSEEENSEVEEAETNFKELLNSCRQLLKNTPSEVNKVTGIKTA